MHVRKKFGHEILKPMSTIICKQSLLRPGCEPSLIFLFREISNFSGKMLKRKIFVFCGFAPRKPKRLGTRGTRLGPFRGVTGMLAGEPG